MKSTKFKSKANSRNLDKREKAELTPEDPRTARNRPTHVAGRFLRIFKFFSPKFLADFSAHRLPPTVGALTSSSKPILDKNRENEEKVLERARHQKREKSTPTPPPRENCQALTSPRIQRPSDWATSLPKSHFFCPKKGWARKG